MAEWLKCDECLRVLPANEMATTAPRVICVSCLNDSVKGPPKPNRIIKGSELTTREGGFDPYAGRNLEQATAVQRRKNSIKHQQQNRGRIH